MSDEALASTAKIYVSRHFNHIITESHADHKRETLFLTIDPNRLHVLLQYLLLYKNSLVSR